MSRLRDALAHPSIVRRAAIVAALCTSPALFHRFELDDRLQRVTALGGGFLYEHGPFDLFTFLDGVPEHTHSLLERGLGPWWGDTHARISFFRPIASAVMWFDYNVLRHAVAIHLHSILWYAALVAIVAALYRRLIEPLWIAGLAALLFAVDHEHGLLVGWIAQRNTLLSGAFGLGALLLHVRGAPILGALSLSLALFSGEAGLGVVPYVLAWTWFLGEKRLRSLLPHAAALTVWAVLYVIGRHGVKGSGLYLDPLHQPVAFLGNVVTHAPLLISSALGNVFIDFYPLLSGAPRVALIAGAMVTCLAFAWVIAPLFRRDPVIRFFLVGAALSVIPSCATAPSARLTLFASFGVLGVLARMLAAARDGAEWWPARGEARWLPSRFFLVWSAYGHVFLSPLLILVSMSQMTIVERVLQQNANGIPDVPEISRQRVVLLNPPDATFSAYLPMVRAEQGHPPPAKLLSMVPGLRPFDLRRDDARTLTLISSTALVQPGIDMIFRGKPFTVGERIVFTDVVIEVMRVNDGFPAEVRFRFEAPLEDPSLRFLQWKNQTLEPLPLPAVGQTVAFPGQTIQPF